MTFVSIRFFDIMVSAAETQGIDWHMWLFYYVDFIKKLTEVYEINDPSLDRTHEFPSRASFLIHEIFSALLSWIGAASSLESSSPHRRIERANTSHENNNIPKSAAIALGRCLGLVLSSPSIGPAFRQGIHDFVLSRLADLDENEEPDRSLRAAFIHCIISPAYGGDRSSYKAQLKVHFAATDHVIRGRLLDYSSAL